MWNVECGMRKNLLPPSDFGSKVWRKGKRVLSFASDDVNNDGGADERRDGIEGDDTTLAGEETDEVADEGDDGAAEDGSWQKHTVVVGG